MIKFISLRFKNAVTFDKTVTVPLQGQGRVFLAGDNKDTGGSNGAGKSTIFEVLQHVLFSSTSKGFSRNKFAANGYLAELVMEADGHKYKILQFRGAKKQERKDGYKIFKDGVDVTPKGTRHMLDCIQYIKEIIGITEDEFRGYVYLAQEGPGHVLISGKGAEKRNYLSDLFNLDRYDSVKEGVEEELENINRAISVLSEKVAVQQELQSQLDDIALSVEDFEAYDSSLRAARQFVEERHAVWSEKLKVEENSRTKASERVEVRSKLDKIFPKWAEIDVEEQTETRQVTLRKLNTRISKLESLKELQDEKSELEEDYIENLDMNEKQAATSLREAQAKLADLESELRGVKRRLVLEEKLPDISAIEDDVTVRLSEAEVALGVINHRLAEAQSTLKKTEKLTEAECPTCGQSLDQKAIEEQRTRAQAIVTNMSAALSSTDTEIAALQSLVERLEQHEKLSAQIDVLPSVSLDSHKEALTAYTNQVAQLEEVLEQAKKNARIARRLSELASQIVEYPDTLDVSKLEEYSEKASKIERSLTKLETLRRLKGQFSDMDEIELMPEGEYGELVDKAKHYEEAQTEIAVLDAEAFRRKSTAQTLQNRLEELKSDLSEWEPVQHRKSLFEAMKAAYGPKGLKITQLKKVCNAICRTLPKYTTIMFQEPRVEFFVDNDPDSTDIEFYVRRFTPEGTEEYPVGKLSGGEKKRLAVAMIFALAELVSPRKRCNLIVLDEVGDGLDGIGEEAFASQLLPQLSQDTVICTSHRPGIEAAQFDKHWTVTKRGNRSTLDFYCHDLH
jgi:DNA repair exonuclease SbcCD ATPase subunit